MRIAFVFPGQGSQSVGMLSGFADNAVAPMLLSEKILSNSSQKVRRKCSA